MICQEKRNDQSQAKWIDEKSPPDKTGGLLKAMTRLVNFLRVSLW
jgi:hypothetical protein